MTEQCNDKEKISYNDPTQSNTDFSAQQFSGVDTEKHKDIHQSSSEAPQLERRLKSRHLQMIAVGGAVGTGLFISSGGALAKAGPVGALIAFLFVGSIVFTVMVSLGEIATFIPIPGAFTAYAARLLDPSLGFSMGWIYWFSWAITFALELTATGLLIQFWNDSVPIAIFIAIFWAVIIVFNLLPVQFYGEMEFWLCSIKILTIIGFMIFAICVNAGVGKQGYLGFQYWVHPGAFAPYLIESNPATGKFVGFWAVLIQASFSYQGTELVGVAAGETENPRKTVPAAIRTTFYRILFFFCLTVLFIGIIIPSTNPNLLGNGGSGGSKAGSSPFVIAARLAGVPVLPDIINAVLLTVVVSAANSNVYSGSRILLGLAYDGLAPPWFKITSKKGVPWVSVLFTAAFGLLGFLNVSAGGSTVFNWFLNITSVAGLVNWACLNACQLAFYRAFKARGLSRDILPYKGPFQPYLSAYGLFFNIIIIFTQGFVAWVPEFSVRQFFVSYISLILWAILYVGHKVWYRQGFVDPLAADIDTGRIAIEYETWETSEPSKPWYKKVWRMIAG